MDMFEKATKAARNVTESVVNSAKTVGNSLYSSTKEQSELASLTVQKSVIEKKLTDSYAEIGKRYIEYMEKCEGGEVFDVSDVLEKIQPELDKLSEIKNSIAEKQVEIKKSSDEKAQKRAQDEYESEKAKLEKALDMDIITQEEYEQKLAAAQRKLDNFELLHKIEMQYEMGIISKEEYHEKVKSVLS